MSVQNAITFEPVKMDFLLAGKSEIFGLHNTVLHQCFLLFPYLWRRWQINFKPDRGLHKAQWNADH